MVSSCRGSCLMSKRNPLIVISLVGLTIKPWMFDNQTRVILPSNECAERIQYLNPYLILPAYFDTLACFTVGMLFNGVKCL